MTKEVVFKNDIYLTDGYKHTHYGNENLEVEFAEHDFSKEPYRLSEDAIIVLSSLSHVISEVYEDE